MMIMTFFFIFPFSNVRKISLLQCKRYSFSLLLSSCYPFVYINPLLNISISPPPLSILLHTMNPKNICMATNFLFYSQMNIVLQAVIVGLLSILFGWIASFLVRPYFKVSLPEICKSWNKNRVMEVTLFVGVFLGWLICKPLLRSRF